MEAVILIGVQGAGKSTFYKERFFDTHVRINLDMLKTARRERLLLGACLDAGQPFVVDKTNATPEKRAPYVAAARAAGFRVAGYFFDVPPGDAARRNRARAGRARVPDVAVFGTFKLLRPPRRDEGFDELYSVRFDDAGGFVVEELAEEI